MPLTHDEIETAIAEASAAMDLDPSLKGTVAAREFGANYTRLMARRRGRPASNTRGGHNKKLTTPQDSAVKEYLLFLHALGTSPNREVLILASNRVLYYCGSDATVSTRWAKSWLSRNIEWFKTLRSKPISSKRRDAHIIEDVEGHFEEFKRCKEHWGIYDDDVSNFDETGCQIGVLSGDKVIVPADCKAAYHTDPDNRELVTAVVTLNYGRKRIPPMIIFAGAYHLRKYFDNDMDGDTLFARSPTGFLNDKLGLVYLKHFDKFTKDSRKGKYRMLLFDGHGSHITQEFINYCWENAIRPFRLPAHLTHLLQPLDVSVFKSFKHNFRKEIRREVFNGVSDISKTDFFSFFQRFYDRTMTSRIHASGFKRTGLIPYNPQIVLDAMKEYQAQQRIEESLSS